MKNLTSVLGGERETLQGFSIRKEKLRCNINFSVARIGLCSYIKTSTQLRQLQEKKKRPNYGQHSSSQKKKMAQFGEWSMMNQAAHWLQHKTLWKQ